MAQSEKIQTKKFFGQLRRLATTLERDVPTLQAVANRRLPSSTLGGPPLVLLTDVKKEVDKIMREARVLQESLQKGNRLLELVETGRSLIDAQRQQVEAVESYLQQYGYTPLPVVPREEAEVVVNEAQEKNVEVPAPSVTSEVTDEDEAVQPKDADVKNIIPTPVPKPEPIRDEFHSPKLEDFGLSEEYLAKRNAQYARLLQPAAPPPIPAQPEFKEPFSQQPIPESDMPPTPESFSQIGALVTPGLFSGREIPTETPSHFLRGPHVRGLPVSELKANCQLHLDFEDASVLSVNSNNTCISNDSGNISGIAELSKDSQISESPMPLRLKQVTQDAGRSPASPLLPVFTSKVGQKFAQELKQKTTVAEVKKQGISSESSTEYSPIPPQFTTPGLSLHPTIKHADRQKPSLDSEADDDLPKKPILNRNLDYDSDEFEMPKTPEFTTDFKTLRANIQLGNSTVPSVQSSKLAGNVPIMDSLAAPLPPKENVPPSLTPATPSAVMIALIDNVTQSEYLALPEYLRKVFTLATINNHLATMNRVFIKNIAKRENAEIAESDLHAHIGQEARIFSLLMTKLKRLKQIKRVSSGTVYVPYDVTE